MLVRTTRLCDTNAWRLSPRNEREIEREAAAATTHTSMTAHHYASPHPKTSTSLPRGEQSGSEEGPVLESGIDEDPKANNITDETSSTHKQQPPRTSAPFIYRPLVVVEVGEHAHAVKVVPCVFDNALRTVLDEVFQETQGLSPPRGGRNGGAITYHYSGGYGFREII